MSCAVARLRAAALSERIPGMGAARYRIGFRSRNLLRSSAAALFLFVGLPFLAPGLSQLTSWLERQPPAEHRALFQGVDYVREVIQKPAPAVVHIIKVDLSAPGVRVLVTPPDFPQQRFSNRARTTSQFLSEFGVQVAINASFFAPFDERNLLSLVPFIQGQKEILAGAASRGVPYGEPSRYFPMLSVSVSNHATIGFSPPRPWYMATGGFDQFIAHGKPIFRTEEKLAASTTVGTDRSGSKLFLVVVDGGQPPYSAGLDRTRLTKLLLDLGVFDALRLDGGGSSTMVVADRDGRPKLLSRPAQAGIPWLERPVGNHIGIYAMPLSGD